MKNKISKYLFFTMILSILSINSTHASDGQTGRIHIQSEAAVLIDGDTGQVLYEKNMHARMYPASITKIMTALLALEQGNMTDIITMSYDAVYTVGRDTSHIALDENEKITLEQALYALAIESANDAANGIAELISGNMEAFAKKMTAKAKELGAKNTNFSNAHGLPDDAHYTSAYDMARIMSAAVKIPEFNKIFSAILYEMPATNRQSEARSFNRKNSLIEGPNRYDGVIAEKTGWTGSARLTYVAAARRNGRTLIAVVMKSPDSATRWAETAALFDYGFNEFIPVSYNAVELTKEQYMLESADGVKTNMDLISAQNFDCLILKSLKKEDIDINYVFSTSGADGKINGKAVFTVKSELSVPMFTELGEVNLQIYFNEPDGLALTNEQQDEMENSEKEDSVFSKILSVASVILQIIGGIAIIILILYIRYHIIKMKRKKKKRSKRIYAAHSQSKMDNRYRF